MRRAGAVAALVVLPALVLSVATSAAARTSGSGIVHARFAGTAAHEASSNWAGYAVLSSNGAAPTSFTSVTGTWTVTSASCDPTGSSSASASAFWVGLGGYSTSSQALAQIGTDGDCSDSGVATYYAWYELVPEPPVNLAIKIRPGDTITTSVNVSGNTVMLQLKNRTRRTVYTKRATTSAIDLSSAEWITEAPSDCSRSSCTPVPLSNFGTVTFSRIATIGNGHPGTLTDPAWTATPIQLVPHADGGFYPGPDRGYFTQSSSAGTGLPAGLMADGRSFSLAWLANASSGA